MVELTGLPLQLSMGVNRNIETNWWKFLTNKNELEQIRLESQLTTFFHLL